MTRIVEWLLGLEKISIERDAPLLIKWQVHLAPWLLFVLTVLAIAFVVGVYHREKISRTRRVILAGFRVLLVGLVIAVICQPVLVRQRDRVEPSHVALLVDTSQSMASRDRYSDTEMEQRVRRGTGLDASHDINSESRLSLVTRALKHQHGQSLGSLLEKNAVQFGSFATSAEMGAFVSGSEGAGQIIETLETLKADGISTDPARAIADTIRNAQGRRLAGIVLASDGRSTGGADLKGALDLASDRQIPIFPIRVGSADRWLDVEVGSVRAEPTVFVNDVVLFETSVAVHGSTEPEMVQVELVDERVEAVVSSKRVSCRPGGHDEKVELTVRPTMPGIARFQVRVTPLANEQLADNNVARVDVQVLDDRVRVLYVDGYPRYEYRYLKNAMLREKTVSLSTLLIDADDQFVQEGTDPIRRFPETPEELNRYDVVIFGDVDPRGGWLSTAQMTMLLDFVGHQGGGFALVAGERFAPHRFLGTPLERLVPVRIDPEFLGQYESTLTVGYRPSLTSEGSRSRLFRPFVDEENDEEAQAESPRPQVDPRAIFDELPELYWFSRTLGPRPGASVLAVHPTARSLAGPMPLMVIGRFGAGRIFFQGTDDTWRWRRQSGELLHDSYWVQVARVLCRGDRLAGDRRFVMRVDQREYSYGTPVNAQLEILDPELVDARRESLSVNVRQSAGLGSENSDVDQTVVGRFELRRIGENSNSFEGTFVPGQPGSYMLELEETLSFAAGTGTSPTFRVHAPDLEGRNPSADHATLQRMAEQTGGRVLELDELESGFADIPDRSVRIPDDVVEPLWDSKLSLFLFVLLISSEWVLRKVFGLL